MAKRPSPLADAGADDDALPARTLIEHTYGRLRDDIVDGRLKPGEKLRVEHLKARYGASAGTLREAITRLSSDALVESVGQRGFRVAPMALAELEDITSLRLHIELDALRRSIRHGGPGWRDEVTRVYQELSAIEQPLHESQRKRWEALNARFHIALIEPAATPWTRKVLGLLTRHGERYRRCAIGLDGSSRDVHAEHAMIFEAAVAGQEARAALALEAHIRATPELLQRHWVTADTASPATPGFPPSRE